MQNIIQEDTATGTDGSAVDLSLWNYSIVDNSYYTLNGYYGGISDGKITGTIPAEINGKPVKTMNSTFIGCSVLIYAPVIPDSVTNIDNTFNGCTGLISAPIIPDKVINMKGTFLGCSNLTQPPIIPEGVTDLTNTFGGCRSLAQAPLIPDGIVNISNTFQGCTALTQAPAIPNSVTNMSGVFSGCTNLLQAPVISGISGIALPTLSINAADDYGISAYAVTATSTAPTSCWQESNTFSDMQNGTYYAWAIDEAGNVSVGSEFLYTGGKVAVPTNLVITPSAISIDLAWKNVLGADSYDIALHEQVISDITQTTYTLTGLASGTPHIVKVRAKNASGTGSWSETANIYTLLNTPSNVTVTATTTTLALSWYAVNNATNYDIELNGTIVQSSEQNSCVVSGITPATQYKIRIKARNNNTGSAWSSELSVTTLTSTNAGGTLSKNTTWTAANSPYILNSSLTIPNGVTLTVEPGVVVKSTGQYSTIDIVGKLVALGINVYAAGEFIGDNVRIRYGGTANGISNYSMLNVLGKLTLTNSEITDSFNRGVYFDTIQDASIKGSAIKRSKADGIVVSNKATGAMILENNIIEGNAGGIAFSSYGTGVLSVKNNNM